MVWEPLAKVKLIPPLGEKLGHSPGMLGLQEEAFL